MESYSAFIDVQDTKGMQMAIALSQSKIGYAYPEIYVCVPQQDGSLKYIYIDAITSRAWKCDEGTFMDYYMHAEPLTEEKFNELHLFTGTMQETAKAMIEMFTEDD